MLHDSPRAPAVGEAPSTVQPQTLSLPKGGGALRGIGEKFAANPVTGTASLRVPIATSPGRGGFGPQLALTYDSGSGNGPFGFGWSLQLPQISRKTDKGLPRYQDETESDVFILSGAEDLVPVLNEDGTRFVDTTSADGYTIHRYRPRVEGLFSRIERWTHIADRDTHWRSWSRDNILTIYGRTAEARIADPSAPHHVFAWLICETRDDKGNGVLYQYKAEDGAGVDLTHSHERNRGSRNDPRRTTNRYLKRVRYGNRLPLLDSDGQRPQDLSIVAVNNADWMFEVVFDYGEHDRDAPTPDDGGTWAFRCDPCSSYRAGFEVRTSRVCQRVLMFHHFPENGVGRDCLVRSTDFTYPEQPDAPHLASEPVYTFLEAVTQVGYQRTGTGYVRGELPKLTFTYSRPRVDDVVRDVSPATRDALAGSLSGTHQWIDLHGEGSPGILTEHAGAWFYRRNVSAGTEPVEMALSAVECLVTKPNVSVADGSVQLLDLAGDGALDVVVGQRGLHGFYEHDGLDGWRTFRAFSAPLNRDTRAPNVQFIDLDGDGRADVLIDEDDAFVWHRSLGEHGYEGGRRIAKALDDQRGPTLVAAEPTESVYLADLSGDGLSDLVRVRNGEVCYWPNLGYGRFGAKVTMDHAPFFDHPDQFDPRRIRLADIDGTGTADIIYLHRDGVRLFFNQCGNSWSRARMLSAALPTHDAASIVASDLLGNGTLCLVWSSPLPADATHALRYVDVMGGSKPHLLTGTDNNMGAQTHVRYAPSTRFYQRDLEAGRPWATRLPFPVQVVERIETVDALTQNRLMTRYVYHDGFFDGEEREFRGFASVEQWDSEGTLPPAVTRSWFHTGALHQPGPLMPANLSTAEYAEACRALTGVLLRQEIYGFDDTPRSAAPYTVKEQTFAVRCLQRRGANHHAVFIVDPRETVTSHYEREASDPRTQHVLTLEVDPFGHVLKQVAVAYGRRASASDPIFTIADATKQSRTLITFTQNEVTNAIATPSDYRTPLPAETRTYELTGFVPATGHRFTFDEWVRGGFGWRASTTEIAHEAAADHVSRQQRLLERAITRYRSDDLSVLLPVGQLQALAVPGETHRLALTSGLVSHIFKRRRQGAPDERLLPSPAAVLEGRGADEGGYVAFDNAWWVPSGRTYLDRAADANAPAVTAVSERATARRHFYQPQQFVDAFGHSTVVEYDAYDLFPRRSQDTLGNVVQSVSDYRVLQTSRVTDPNGNRSAACFDALGMVVAIATMGKETEQQGDELEGFEANLALSDIQHFVADPATHAPALLGNATTRTVYDLDRFRRCGQPAISALLARQSHVHDAGGATTRIVISFTYTDGFGREIQKKIPAESGGAPERRAPVVTPTGDAAPGALVTDASGAVVSSVPSRRWVGTGRTVFSNKGSGKPLRRYEPFFSATHLYEPEPDMTDTGASSLLLYDPVERLVATLRPDHTYDKAVFTPWQHTTYDVNDTVTMDPSTDPDVRGFLVAADGNARVPRHEYQPAWHASRIVLPHSDAAHDAAEKAAAHADTPTVTHLDVLGRPFLTVADNGPAAAALSQRVRFATRVDVDIQGNQRAVIDANGRVAMRYDVDMLGTQIHQTSMDAGERWMLADVTGKPIRRWDSRGHRRRLAYDALRRPTALFVTDGGSERMAERLVYGESQGDAGNHRTRIFELYDAAGRVQNTAYDFKGNLAESRRELLASAQTDVDWSANPALTGAPFVTVTSYDALNRAVTVRWPDLSVTRSSFNDAGLLERVEVNHRGALSGTSTPVWTPIVTNIDYNAKGQRERVAYGNGASTSCHYDPLTFRLEQITTTRPGGGNGLNAIFADPTIVQDQRYTYDPIGNVTRVEDRAAVTVFHNGQQVTPVARYTYDPVYRLITATGREHIGQAVPASDADLRDYAFAGRGAHPHDLQALRCYTQHYDYDAIGNFKEVRHVATGGSWTRRYDYGASSLLDAAARSNRVTTCTIGNGINHVESYTYDAHGNAETVARLSGVRWDFKDALAHLDLGGGGMASYVYDSAGQRVRKVIESSAGVRRKERIYIGAYEVYREYASDGVTVAMERESLHMTDGRDRVAVLETQTIAASVRVNTPKTLTRFKLQDHAGSAVVELDADANVISYEEYHPYGTTAFQVHRAEVPANRFRFVGKERDEESGLCYFGARYYAPWLGRWISADPLGIAQSTNLYWYARANPARFYDPNGNDDTDWQDEQSYAERFALWVDEKVGAENMQTISNASAGFGDYVSFGLTDKAREALGTNGVVDKASDAYLNGAAAGFVHQTVLGAATVPASIARFGAAKTIGGVAVGIVGTPVVNAGLDAVDPSGTASATFNTTVSLLAPARLARSSSSKSSAPLEPEVLPPDAVVPAKPAKAPPPTIDIYPETTAPPTLTSAPPPRLALPPGEGNPPLVLKGGGVHEVATTSTPRNPTQNALMGGSAKDLAGRPDAQHLHLVALTLGGTQARSNLVLGSAGANYIMLPFELMLRESRRTMGNNVRVDAGAYVAAGTDYAHSLYYKAWINGELVLDATLNAWEKFPSQADRAFWTPENWQWTLR